ncbi:MAG: Wzz/FepE/Etk N-terminal domain-containing protein [Planctomycetota bacterium]
MSNSAYTDRSWINYITGVVWNNKWLIVLPMLLFGGLAFAYAVFKPASWTASQSLIIRDDLVGAPAKPGRFDSQESLMSAQETIQEIVGKQELIRAVLEELGPAPGTSLSGSWPDADSIESGQGAVSIGSPGGTEFGKSEVIVLTAKAQTPERAMEFARLVINELEARLQAVRIARVQSMTAERQLAVEYAQAAFDESATRLEELEASFGADLSSIRSMVEQFGAESPLQRSLIEVRAEKRRLEAELDKFKLQHETLTHALGNPSQLTATSSDLLKLQPRLQQLVTGLNEAEIKLSELVGRYEEIHPNLINGREAVADINQQIRRELSVSIELAAAQVSGAEQLLSRKANEQAALEQRLSEIASNRVNYARLNEEVKKKSEILADARGRLSELGSFSDERSSVALLTLVGEISVPARADGPGVKMLTAMGLIAGLFGGFGLVLLVAPPFKPETPYQAPPIANAVAGRAGEVIAAGTARASEAIAAGTARAGEALQIVRQKAGTAIDDDNSSADSNAQAETERRREPPFAGVVSTSSSSTDSVAAAGIQQSADSSRATSRIRLKPASQLKNAASTRKVPVDDAPVDETPVDDTPVDETPAVVLPVEGSVPSEEPKPEKPKVEEPKVEEPKPVKAKPVEAKPSFANAEPAESDESTDALAEATSKLEEFVNKNPAVNEIQPQKRSYKRRPTPTSQLLADKQQVLREIETKRTDGKQQTEAGRRLEALTSGPSPDDPVKTTDLDMLRSMSSESSKPGAGQEAVQQSDVREPVNTVELGSAASDIAPLMEDAAESLSKRLAESAAPSPEQIVREIRRRREKEALNKEDSGAGEKVTPARRRPRSANPFMKNVPVSGVDTTAESPASIPEQVKNLSKTIAEFCEPLKGQASKTPNDSF